MMTEDKKRGKKRVPPMIIDSNCETTGLLFNESASYSYYSKKIIQFH